jgi:transcriptional regulator with XRE-family HTH domain
MAIMNSEPSVGLLLREWRKRRQLTQLDLALDAGVSPRHVSFIETGRSKPSAEMVLALATQLEVPVRERNHLLLAAGYAPVFPERSFTDPEMAPVREALDLILTGHEPYPAVVIDRSWNVVASNSAIAALSTWIDPELLKPPVNAMRVGLHPKGLAQWIINLGEVRAHFVGRLGVGALFSPAKMAATRLAADTKAQPEARLFVRGFGAHQVLVALLGLVGRRWRTIEKPAALAAVAIDLADMISAVAEARSRKALDADLTGGLVFSAAGVATAGPILLAQR